MPASAPIAAPTPDALTPLLGTASREEVPLHLEHLPERFSLFVILVLAALYESWAMPVAILPHACGIKNVVDATVIQRPRADQT